MEYVLAFDKKENWRIKERFIKISSTRTQDLQIICELTMQYDKLSLKRKIAEINSYYANKTFFDLVILNDETKETKRVPYKEDSVYFNPINLCKLMSQNLNNSFLESFIINYQPKNQLEKELLQMILKTRKLNRYQAEWTIYAFIREAIYINGKLNFERLFELSMLFSALLSEKIQEEQKSEEIFNEIEQLEIEWLLTRTKEY